MTTFVSTNGQKCSVCGNNHKLYACDKFKEFSVIDRRLAVKKLNLCFNCLNSNHYTQQCMSRSCTKCNRKHNTLLHIDEDSGNTLNLSTLSNSSPCSHPVSIEENDTQCQANSNKLDLEMAHSPSYTHCAQTECNKQILLSTAIVNIQGNGQTFQCRALLDSASQSHFISESLAQRLGIKRNAANIPVKSINGKITTIKHKITTAVTSRISGYSDHLEFLIVPTITGIIPSKAVDIKRLHIPVNIKLADPAFSRPGRIDVLLGAEIFFTILKEGKLRLSTQNTNLQETEFGWIVAGKVDSIAPSSSPSIECHLNEISGNELNEKLKQFWALETCTDVSTLSPEEKMCEDLFTKTTTRDKTGKYTVHLPFKKNVSELGEAKQAAINRFKLLERKLLLNSELKLQYSSFIAEYINLGHMQKLSESEEITQPKYFLPHHAVLKPESTTTKLRVVFDGSSKSSSLLSLNDVLMVGPTVQQTLTSIIMRFRKHRYAFTADIEKMYRQVNVYKEHANYQCIVWRDHPHHSINTYRLNTVTYGTASAPYLATRTMKQLALDESIHFPLASFVLLQDTYVDDVLSGHSDIEKALQIQEELISLVKSGGMNLRKWCSNCIQLLSNIPIKDQEIQSHQSNTQITIKTLGIIWNPVSDTFSFNIKQPQASTSYTKRKILSDIASLFDPLGLLSPIIVLGKIFMQSLWCIQSDWDEEIPEDHINFWLSFLKEIPIITTIKVNRFIMTSSPQLIEIHGFSDASEKAYGACIYIKTTDQNFSTTIHLLCSKSRVAPLKKITVPRLELCAAHLLSVLLKDVIDAMQIKPNHIYLWTDSTIVLGWIKKSAHLLKTFVANRVSKIQDLTANYTWKYIPTNDNPADIVSRGSLPTELKKNSIWWHGPSFLNQPKENWPTPPEIQTILPEQKTTELYCSASIIETVPFIVKYSSFKT